MDMRLVLDTNVVVAALRSPSGASVELIGRVLDGDFTILLSVALRLPASLKAALAQISKEDGTSMNQFVVTAVAEKICAMKTAEFFASKSDAADVQAARRVLHRDGGQPQHRKTGGICEQFAVLAAGLLLLTGEDSLIPNRLVHQSSNGMDAAWHWPQRKRRPFVWLQSAKRRAIPCHGDEPVGRD